MTAPVAAIAMQVHYKTANCSGGDVLGVWTSAILSVECLPENESFSLRGGTALRVSRPPCGPQSRQAMCRGSSSAYHPQTAARTPDRNDSSLQRPAS